MSKEQTVWAAGHDWFRRIEWSREIVGYVVVAWCSTDNKEVKFTDFNELRRWAGY